MFTQEVLTKLENSGKLVLQHKKGANKTPVTPKNRRATLFTKEGL